MNILRSAKRHHVAFGAWRSTTFNTSSGERVLTQQKYESQHCSQGEHRESQHHGHVYFQRPSFGSHGGGGSAFRVVKLVGVPLYVSCDDLSREGSLHHSTPCADGGMPAPKTHMVYLIGAFVASELALLDALRPTDDFRANLPWGLQGSVWPSCSVLAISPPMEVQNKIQEFLIQLLLTPLPLKTICNN